MGYIEDLEKYLKQSKLKLNKKEQQEILRVYNKAFDNMLKQYKSNIHKKNATQIARTAYCNQLHSEILSIIKEYNIKVTDDILNAQVDTLMQGVDYYKDTELYKNVMKQASIVNRQVIEQMIKGSIYKDGKGLSKRLWKDVNASGDKIETAIASLIAEGKGATEIAKNLTQFAKGGHRTWDKAKIKEKLGSAYAGRYGAGGIDYEALRLARTTLNHQAQLTQKNANKVNPYAQKLKWHSAHAANRSCNECIEREGKIYDVDKCPFDHPNGMCHLENIFCINGKEVSSTQMAEDIGKWVRGENNSGTMDILYGDVPLENKTSNISKNKHGKEIKFEIEGMREKNQERIKETITELSSQYNTNLNTVFKGKGKEAGHVNLNYDMYLSSSRKNDIVHEFAHSLAISPRRGIDTGNKEFWKDIKKVRKEYTKACATDVTKRISAYSTESVDEFMAEAFTHAYLKGTKHTEGWYGTDFEYSERAMEVINKYFKKK